jgi:hypothetical protein
MRAQTTAFLIAFAVRGSNAAFNLLTGFDATIQDAFGISSKCLSAMYVCRTVVLFLINKSFTGTQRLPVMKSLREWPRKERTRITGTRKTSQLFVLLNVEPR